MCRPALQPALLPALYALGTVAILSLPPATPAQGPITLGAFGARDDALPTAPYLGGATFTSYTGPFGLRLSGGLNINRTDNSLTPFPEPQWCSAPGGRSQWGNGQGCGPGRYDAEPHDRTRFEIGAWTADADFMFAPFRVSRILTALVGGFSPYGFVGIGGHGLRFRNSPDTAIATWSYGVGAYHRLISGLGIEGEGRYRMPLHNTSDPLPYGFTRGWEYRIGLSVSFGGGHNVGSIRRRRDRGTRDTERSCPCGPDSPPDLRFDWRHRRSPVAERVLDLGARYVGTPYRYGSASPDDGFDAGGFVQYVYGRAGIRLPRTARQMAHVGERVEPSLDALRPGDLLLFATERRGSGIDHVAIYAGDDRILHSSATGDGVRYDDLDRRRGRWFLDRLVAARRVVRTMRTWERDDDTEFDPPDRAPRP
jgi:cell wall-associated NlpC family hydrolase